MGGGEESFEFQSNKERLLQRHLLQAPADDVTSWLEHGQRHMSGCTPMFREGS